MIDPSVHGTIKVRVSAHEVGRTSVSILTRALLGGAVLHANVIVHGSEILLGSLRIGLNGPGTFSPS